MANDESDALDVLEKEAKEYDKVRGLDLRNARLANIVTRTLRSTAFSMLLDSMRKCWHVLASLFKTLTHPQLRSVRPPAWST